MTPGLRNFSFFLSNTFVYEPILLKLSMNANIVKMLIFHEIKYDLRGHSRSQIMTFLIKNSPFLLFMLLIDWRNKCRWTLWKNKVWLIQRRHLPCFVVLTLTYVLMDKFLSLFFFFISRVCKIFDKSLQSLYHWIADYCLCFVGLFFGFSLKMDWGRTVCFS